jgi:hypothetical protein
MTFLQTDRDTSKAYSGADMESLMAMLETKRPHKSKAESKFIRDWIEPLGVERDGFGNLFKLIPGEGDSILWSCHTDTVHYSGGRQAIRKHKGIVTLSQRGKSNCLGADDAAGIWLMREMILAGKPGLYVFHRGEEVGGLGSDFIATHVLNNSDYPAFQNLQAAIALDRKGYSFQDIPECTNLSVGYFGQHSKKECLDTEFLVALRHKLIALDPSKLIIDREPESNSWFDDDNQIDYNGHDDLNVEWINAREHSNSEFDSIVRACRNHPEAIAKLLMEYGITLDEVLQTTCDDIGYIPY